MDLQVLHVIPAVAPRYGGPSAALLALCSALGQQGVVTTIAATDADGAGRLPVELGVATTYNGTRAFFFPRQFSESFKYSRPLSTWLSPNVRSFDVVHVHAVLSHACLAAGRACRAAGVPYVVRPLGTLDPWSLGQKALKKRILMWAAGRRLLRNAAAIHYTSRQEKALVEGAFGLSRGVVIPLGIDARTRTPSDTVCPTPGAGCRTSEVESARPYVLALSRLHPVKALETLIEAFARAVAAASGGGEGNAGAGSCPMPEARSLTDWRLVLAGDGDADYVAQLKRLAGAAGMDGSVQFAGWVDGAAKRALLERASLFAVPSLHENFGVSLVEAMACGVPAVVSPHVHLADDIEEARAGWVADLGFAEALAAAMRNPEERRRRGDAARLLAQRFAWPIVARQLVELYARITQESGIRMQDDGGESSCQ